MSYQTLCIHCELNACELFALDMDDFELYNCFIEIIMCLLCFELGFDGLIEWFVR